MRTLCWYFMINYLIIKYLKGGGDDFESGEYNVTFDVNVGQVCQTIILNDDELSEDLEQFQVVLVSMLPRVSVGPRAIVSIIDDDSK